MEYSYLELVFYLSRQVLAKVNSVFHNLFMLNQTAFIPRMLIYLCIISFAFYFIRRIFLGNSY